MSNVCIFYKSQCNSGFTDTQKSENQPFLRVLAISSMWFHAWTSSACYANLNLNLFQLPTLCDELPFRLATLQFVTDSRHTFFPNVLFYTLAVPKLQQSLRTYVISLMVQLQVYSAIKLIKQKKRWYRKLLSGTSSFSYALTRYLF